MTGNDAGQETSPDVRDKRIPPSGVLPKNTQAWVLSGLAVVMVAVIALSGHNAPKEKPLTVARRRPRRTPMRPRFRSTKAASKKRRKDSRWRKSNWLERSRSWALRPAVREVRSWVSRTTGALRERAFRPSSQEPRKAPFRWTGINANNNRCLLPTSR